MIYAVHIITSDGRRLAVWTPAATARSAAMIVRAEYPDARIVGTKAEA